jgi:hypothetical protein
LGKQITPIYLPKSQSLNKEDIELMSKENPSFVRKMSKLEMNQAIGEAKTGLFRVFLNKAIFWDLIDIFAQVNELKIHSVGLEQLWRFFFMASH